MEAKHIIRYLVHVNNNSARRHLFAGRQNEHSQIYEHIRQGAKKKRANYVGLLMMMHD